MSEQRLDELVSALAQVRPVLDDVARARVAAVVQAACRAEPAVAPRPARRRWAIAAVSAAAAVLVLAFALRDRGRHRLPPSPSSSAPPLALGELPDGALLSAPQGGTAHGRVHGASLTVYGPGWAARRAGKIVVDADAFVVDRSGADLPGAAAGNPASSSAVAGAPAGDATPAPPDGVAPADPIVRSAPGPAATAAPLEIQLRTATIHVQYATFSVYNSRGLQVTVLRGEIVLSCRGTQDRKITAGRTETCGTVRTAAASPPAGAPGGDAAAVLPADAAAGAVGGDVPSQPAPQAARAPLVVDAPANALAANTTPSSAPSDRMAATPPGGRPVSAGTATTSPVPGAAADRRATSPVGGVDPGRTAVTAASSGTADGRIAVTSLSRGSDGAPRSTSPQGGGADRSPGDGEITVGDVSRFPFAAGDAAAPPRIAVDLPRAEGAVAAAPVAAAPVAAAPVAATPAERYAAAERLIARDPGAARAALRAIVAGTPDAPEAAPALLDLARLAAAAGDEVAAKAALTQLSAHPAGAALAMPAAYLRCTLEQTRDPYRTCLAAFRAAFPDSPRDAEVLAGLAIATARAGDCASARPLLDESMRRYPKGPNASDVRAWRAHCDTAR